MRGQAAEPALPTRQLLPPAPADLQLGGETSPHEPAHPGTGASWAGTGETVFVTPLSHPQAGHWEPSCSPHSTEQTHISSIFLTYRQLVQGKLRFFFYDLAKVLCKQGQGDSRDPPCGAQ